MRSPSIALILALTAIATLSAADAAQYNKRPHLSPGAEARVRSTIAGARAVDKVEIKSTGSKQKGKRKCGREIDGVIVDKRPGGEKVLVVTKTIVNVGGQVEIASECE